jgi:hypothetical protein
MKIPPVGLLKKYLSSPLMGEDKGGGGQFQ